MYIKTNNFDSLVLAYKMNSLMMVVVINTETYRNVE
jgi:hypothetical protein